MKTAPLYIAPADGPRQPLRLAGASFAAGGDGTLYALPEHPDRVAKIHHDPAAEPQRRAKLEAMLIERPARAILTHDGQRYVQLSWPAALVEDERGALAGYVMPRVDLEQAVLLEQLLTRSARRAYGLPDSYLPRVAAAANLAAIVAALHAEGHAVIDLKPANVHVYRDTFFVALLDCDGMRIARPGGGHFPGHQYTNGYIAPEAARQQAPPEHLGEAQDRFALAVVIFQLLNEGLHPYQGVPAPDAAVPPTNQQRIADGLYAYGRRPHPLLRPSPWSLHDHFDDATRSLFNRAFGGDPAEERPSAAEWHAHLRWYADPDKGGLVRCDDHTEHWRFAGEACGHCALAAQRAEARKRSSRTDRPAQDPFEEASGSQPWSPQMKAKFSARWKSAAQPAQASTTQTAGAHPPGASASSINKAPAASTYEGYSAAVWGLLVGAGVALAILGEAAQTPAILLLLYPAAAALFFAGFHANRRRGRRIVQQSRGQSLAGLQATLFQAGTTRRGRFLRAVPGSRAVLFTMPGTAIAWLAGGFTLMVFGSIIVLLGWTAIVSSGGWILIGIALLGSAITGLRGLIVSALRPVFGGSASRSQTGAALLIGLSLLLGCAVLLMAFPSEEEEPRSVLQERAGVEAMAEPEPAPEQSLLRVSDSVVFAPAVIKLSVRQLPEAYYRDAVFYRYNEKYRRWSDVHVAVRPPLRTTVRLDSSDVGNVEFRVKATDVWNKRFDWGYATVQVRASETREVGDPEEVLVLELDTTPPPPAPSP